MCRFAWLRRALVAASLGVLWWPGVAAAQTTYGAATSGNWNSAATWTPAGTPGLSDFVFIGSTTPAGSAATATVTLVQGQLANTVYLGYDTGTNGTLNLGSSQLTAVSLYIGAAGGTGTVQRGAGGVFVVTGGVSVAGANTLAFAAGDATSALILGGGATATNVRSGNVTASAQVDGSGSRLTLGGNLTLSGSLSASSGGAVDLAGHGLTAASVSLDGAGTGLLNRGPLTATSALHLSGGQGFAFGAGDGTPYLQVTGGRRPPPPPPAT